MFMEEVFNPVKNRATLSEETMAAWRENTWGANGQAIDLPDDMSEQYNTQLSDEQEKQYTQWAKDNGRELDVQNYDLRGAWLEMQQGDMSEDARGHLGDKYKKPNHPTFSAESIYNGKEGVQGGKWEQNGNIWSYTPGRKLTKDQAKRLEKYFQENEAGNYLNLKDKVYKDPVMFMPGKTPGFFDGITDVLWKPMADAAFRFASTGLMAASKGMFWVRDDFREQMAKASEDLDDWTRANFGPDPQTMGTATMILYGLMNTLPELALIMTGAGAAARLAFNAASAGYKVRTAQLAIGSAMFGTDLGVAERNRLVNEGVDKDTAFNAGMVSGITNTIGVALPPFLGASRTMSAIYGGVSNVGINYAELKTIQYVLENQNYNELAQQYQLGLTDTIVSATLGAVMGAAFWRHPTQVKYEKAYGRLYDRYRSELSAGGKFSKEESDVQANINSRAVLSLAKMSGISPDKIDDFAAKITWSEDGKSLSVPAEYAMKMAENIETRYNEAVAKGDMVTAEALVKEYAKVRGYTLDEDYRDMHSAPKASVAKEDFTNLDKLREVAEESGDVNIFAIANDVSIVPSDFFTSDGWWQYSNRNNVADSESFSKIRKAIDSIQRQTREYGRVKHMPTVWVYRAVPKSVKEGKLQSDGQWVTPSREYAKQHGQSRFGAGEYRIIKEAVPADQLWFNGDSINEWGFDNGEKYVYKNTTNNRKRYDAIVRDFDGNIVPLSKRFNSRKWEEFYQIIGERGVSVMDQADENWTRTNNRDVALQMEYSGKTPKEIRLATGWERGADGQWRYEIPDLKIKEEGFKFLEEREALIRAEKEDWAYSEEGLKASIEEGKSHEAAIDSSHESDVLTTTLDKLVDAPELFKAYPQLRKMTVEFGKLPKGASGYLSLGTMTIRLGLDADLSSNLTRSSLIHEIQHAIQEIEGFAQGADPKRMPGKGRALFRDMSKLRKLYSSPVWQEYQEATSAMWRLVDPAPEVKEARIKSGLTEEEIQAELKNVEKRQGELERHPDVQAVRAEQKRLTEKYGYDRDIQYAINHDLDPDDPVFTRITESDPNYRYQSYTRVAGEVEARNAQARKDMSPEERKNSLLRETESYPRDEQLITPVNGGEFYQNTLGEMLPYERTLAIEDLAWKNFVNRLTSKPTGNVVMLKQLPLVFNLIGYKGRIEATELRASPHLFDGLLAINDVNYKGQNAHRNMDKAVLSQLPRAITEPIAVFRRFGAPENEFIFMVDIKDKAGGTVVVPIGINMREGFLMANVVKTAYTKTSSRTGRPDNDWFFRMMTTKAIGAKNGEMSITPVYADMDKVNRWNTSSGSHSHSVLSNGLFRNVKTKDDLVKLRETLGNRVYQNSQGGIRGSFNPAENRIRLTPNANLSTFSHEHAHWYLTNVLSLAGKEGATLELQTQAMAILRMFGIKSLDEWNALGFEGQRKYQERFASLTELYLTEGKAAVPGLEGVFKKFAEWLLDMYKSVLGKDADNKAQAKEIGDRYEAQFGEKLPELSPDVRKVLDKMYGAQEKFVPTKAQTSAARIVQAVRVNTDKINAPIENSASPEVANRATAIQGKAESDLNNGRKVDVSSEVGDLTENVPVVNEAQRTFGRAVAVGDGDQSRVVVLQNRDRSAPTSVAQMNSIAADPQYGRLSVSRTTQSGAPIVSFGQIPDQRYQGKSDVLTDSNGDKVPVTYFVVEADSVMRSNNVDGTPNPQWNEDHPESMRAVAGNGRMAGLNEAYNRGTAEKYRNDLIADEENHGVSADVIRGMKKPVLVRYMDPDNVTTGFIERSNTSDVLVRSALETAVQDSPKVRKNIDKYDFDENGDPTRETLGQFLTDVGETSEMGNLLGSDGQPTTTARNRIRAALFYEAYRDNRLTELVADSEDKQGMKRILNAMSAFAPRVIEIREASNGAIDLGPVITGAVNRILQARINGEGVDFSLQTDMFDSNPVTDIFSQFFSNNKNSTAAMLRVLRPFADDLQNRLKAADSPLFEEEAVKTDLADAIGLFRKAENDELRAKSGNLLGDSTEGLLPDIDVAGLRESIARTVQPATELVSSIAEGVRETNVAATPEAQAARLNEHLAEQARAREVLGADSEAARARNMILEDADRVVTINDANGNPIQVRAADLLEHTKTMDQELENDVSGLGTGVACIIRNQGIRP